MTDLQVAEIKSKYPFGRWEEAGTRGSEQFTPEACAAFVAIFDQLLEKLKSLGEHAPEEEKIAAFKEAIEATNAIYVEDDSLIETGEREDLCELCDLIAAAAGIDPENYGGGEGLADEWREW